MPESETILGEHEQVSTYESELMEKAEAYWHQTLEGEELVQEPQDKECKIAIIVPVYDEHVDRIREQLESIQLQEVPQNTFEVIYVINQDKDSVKAEVNTANEEVLQYLREQGKQFSFPVFAIDKISEEYAETGNNVGKARNRGVAEASYRFAQNEKDGWLVQTDADTLFIDPTYLKRILEAGQENPDLVGIAGGVKYRYSFDAKDENEWKALHEKSEKVINRMLWKRMMRFLTDDSYPLLPDTFSGANMITRSLESAAIGGVPELESAEDRGFGFRMKDFAAEHGKIVEGRKTDLWLSTAARESSRTSAGFSKEFNDNPIGQQLLVENPLYAASTRHVDQQENDLFRKQCQELFGTDKKVELNQENLEKMENMVSGLQEGEEWLRRLKFAIEDL